jgi:uncharacterized protein
MAKPSKTAWFNAAKSWDYARIKELLKQAPELLEATDAKGLNALHMACAVKPGKKALHEPNGIMTVTALLDAGIDIESVAFTDDDGGEWRANAVWFATGRGQNLPLMKFLLKRGGDPSYSLFTVLWGYKPEFARELVKYKPRMNLRGGDGRTVLHAAAVPHRLEVLDLYLQAGADPHIKDKAGLTPLDLARKRRVPKEFIERMETIKPGKGSKSMISRPQAKSRSKPPPRPSRKALFDAARIWDADGIKRLLAAAPELASARDPKGIMAIHIACRQKPASAGLREQNGIATIGALLDAGTPLEAAVILDDFQATPVWYAVAHGRNLPLVRFLLKRGADASNCLWAAVWNDDAPTMRAILQTKPHLNELGEGETALFYAARLRRLKALDLLIDAGADPWVVDAKRRTAIDIARQRRIPNVFIKRMQKMARR